MFYAQEYNSKDLQQTITAIAQQKNEPLEKRVLQLLNLVTNYFNPCDDKSVEKRKPFHNFICVQRWTFDTVFSANTSPFKETMKHLSLTLASLLQDNKITFNGLSAKHQETLKWLAKFTANQWLISFAIPNKSQEKEMSSNIIHSKSLIIN